MTDNIRIATLITGQLVVGKLSHKNLSKVFLIGTKQQGQHIQIGMIAPFYPMSKEPYDYIKEEHILNMIPATEDLAKSYLEATTGLSLP